MTRAVGNGMIRTLANAIGAKAAEKLAKQVAGLSTDMADIKAREAGGRNDGECAAAADGAYVHARPLESE